VDQVRPKHLHAALQFFQLAIDFVFNGGMFRCLEADVNIHGAASTKDVEPENPQLTCSLHPL
jgi:hypothetical protein